MSTQKMFRATEALFTGRFRAYNAGDVLSADAVERGAWQGQVEPAGAQEVADAGGPPTKAASKVDWVAYATHADRGDAQLSIADADQLTRDELAGLFSPQGA